MISVFDVLSDPSTRILPTRHRGASDRTTLATAVPWPNTSTPLPRTTPTLCSSGTTGVYVDCQMTRTVAIGTSTLGTTLIAAKTCSAVVTTQTTGVITSDVISYSFSAAPSGAFTTGLVIQSYVTPGNINFLVCNPTENGLVPPAATLNWRVVR